MMTSKLKATIKFENSDELRCAHGLCASTPLSWKEIFSTISKKHLVEYNDVSEIQKMKHRWLLLLKINPRKWKTTIKTWAQEDKLSKMLAEEIRKEIDAMVIKELLAFYNE
jgi:hypothetical protein